MAEQQVQSELAAPEPEVQEDEESVRRRTIAERMARLGGIRFGAPPMAPLSRGPMPSAPPPTSVPPDDSESEAKEEEQSRDEEEEEAARKQRIAAKLAGMGGMRFGMLPPPVGMPPAPVRRPIARQEDSESEDAALPVPVPAPAQRGPPVRRPPPPVQVPVEQEQASDDGVQVEAEESEIEEVHYSDADVPSASAEEEEAPPLPPPRRSPTALRSTEALPTPPPRMISRSPPPGRPPVPSIPATLLNRRPSVPTGSAPSSRKSSVDYSGSTETSTISYIPQRTRPTLDSVPSESGMRPQSEYVMVESEPEPEEAPAPPPRKSMRGPTRSVPLPPPPPPSAIDPPEELASSAQWELPSIPQGAEFGDSDLASSGWSEDSTAVHVPPPVISSPSSRRPSAQLAPSSGRRSIDQQQLTTDDLMTIWGKVGVQVVESATALFEKSKKSLVGDGSHAGFVRAVLAQVPGAQVAPGNEEWGYVVYAQTGSAVQRRVSEIMPGDVIAFWDAKLKGHKGLHAYSQTVGAGDGGALVGIVSEFEAKKSKVRIWQANQHVGQQTVESVSYRLEDLKNGHVKVFRVLEA
ncbi:hypothetical protein HYDPIDRAFT_154226 [Hydnomerulius pinastri MD-312]|uniref:BBC1/AIM3 cysteine proteinase-fold domain-containing protein n=1 Tax=Hydnomerulius pinastri MD-312 TaxID=994086 RepID=A0A0C9VG59_9AGAM|nr:hypothetical protein HYDPIDRAFT_154226 [Hydnomerulius pinastri MD-312]